MLHNYEVKVEFDDEVASVSDKKTYFGIIDEYSASVVGHNNGTSNLFFTYDGVVSQDGLQKKLGDIKIISFEEIDLD